MGGPWGLSHGSEYDAKDELAGRSTTTGTRCGARAARPIAATSIRPASAARSPTPSSSSSTPMAASISASPARTSAPPIAASSRAARSPALACARPRRARYADPRRDRRPCRRARHLQGTTEVKTSVAFETILLPVRHNGSTQTRLLGAMTAIDDALLVRRPADRRAAHHRPPADLARRPRSRDALATSRRWSRSRPCMPPATAPLPRSPAGFTDARRGATPISR